LVPGELQKLNWQCMSAALLRVFADRLLIRLNRQGAKNAKKKSKKHRRIPRHRKRVEG